VQRMCHRITAGTPSDIAQLLRSWLIGLPGAGRFFGVSWPDHWLHDLPLLMHPTRRHLPAVTRVVSQPRRCAARWRPREGPFPGGAFPL